MEKPMVHVLIGCRDWFPPSALILMLYQGKGEWKILWFCYARFLKKGRHYLSLSFPIAVCVH